MSNFVSRYGIETDARINVGPDEPAKQVATTLFRVVQEALTNIAKHAQASRADSAVLQRHPVLRHRAGQRRGRDGGEPDPQGALLAGVAGHSRTGAPAQWRGQYHDTQERRFPPESHLADAPDPAPWEAP